MTIRNFIAINIVFAGLVFGVHAQALEFPASVGTPLSQAQQAPATASGHPGQNYQSLADSYAARQTSLLAQSAKDKADWERLKNPTVYSQQAKYPRPVDWARTRYEYDLRAAAKAGEKAAHYRQLAEASGSNQP
jgi:hypothetical protein